MSKDAGVEMHKLDDLRRSALRNAIRSGSGHGKNMRGYLTDEVFSRYNIQAVDDLEAAARRIEEGAARTLAAATKSATAGETPARCCSEPSGLSPSGRVA